jgi:hypothetical protein
MLDRHPAKIEVGARFHEVERAAGSILSSTGGMDEMFTAASNRPEYVKFRERAREFLPLKEAGL